MAFKDLREYIAALEEHGELRRIKKEVDWNLEAGAIMRLTDERKLPSPFFEKIKGYSPNYRLLGSPLNSYRKLAVAMGLPPETPVSKLEKVYEEGKKRLVKPVLIDRSQASCKENIDIGDRIDLLKFPAPVLHDGDGGRYLCTWHCTITRDPDTGHVNWGMYRFMINTKNSLVGSFRPQAHIGGHFFRKYQPRGIPMPCAIAIGPEPVSGFVASARVNVDISEPDLAGAIRQEPVELVKCETLDLEVPASSEIVIEGEISVTDKAMEGPFGEYTGYSSQPAEPKPIFKVTAVTYRNNPIVPASCVGTPTDEYHIAGSFVKSPEIYERLRREGIPVVAVTFPVECISSVCIVSVRTRDANIPNLPDQVASLIWGSEPGANVPYIYIVEDDVDIFNLGEVMHAMATKCHPWRNIRRVEHGTTQPLHPFLSPYERKHRVGSKAYFDCTWPLEWDRAKDVPQKVSFRTSYPGEMQEQITRNWEEYGFDKL
jgi:phenylphosphate carboxylase alpha subunit